MGNNWLTKKIYEIATKYFHKWYGFISALILLNVISLYVFNLIPSVSTISAPPQLITTVKPMVSFSQYMSVVFILTIILFAYWLFYNFHYPTRSKKRLGIGISVQIEDLEDYIFFQKDFLVHFKKRINELNLPFDILVLKQHQAEKVDTVQDAYKVLKKTKAHFCVWGSIKKREKASKGEQYIFSLQGVVVHNSIKEVQKVLLQNEFEQVLPNVVAFEKSLQFDAFQFRANQLFIAVNYIIGRAALLSYDFNTAILLHESLFKEIQKGQQSPISKDTLKNLLSLEYDIKASIEFFKSDKNYISSVEKSLQYNINNYGALLKRAIIEFNHGRGHLKKALTTIHTAKKYAKGDYVWLYSETFLHFWLEDYLKALKCCEKLKSKSYEGENQTIKEVQQFNENLLKEQDKPQLYYWLGFLNFVKIKNFAQADVHFQKFIEKSNYSTKDLYQSAQGYLAHIKKEIGY